MKKFIALFMAFIFITGCAACAKNEATNTPTLKPTPSETPEMPYMTESVTPTRPAAGEGQKAHPITVRDDRYEYIDGPVMDQFYVAPDGNDSNPGTLDKPFATLEAARQAVAAINADMTGNIYVNIEPGSYQRSTAFTLLRQDGGSKGFSVIYRGTKDLASTITGGRRITGWEKVENGLYRAKVTDVESFRQFYINGRRRTRSNSNNGQLLKNLVTFYNPTIPINLNGADIEKCAVRKDIPADVRYGIIINNADLEGIDTENLKGAEFVLYVSWVVERALIRDVYRIDSKHSVVSLDYLQGRSMFFVPSPAKLDGMPYYFENSRQLLDKPGEWYFDKTSQYLYYMPKEGEDMAKVQAVIPAADKLITIEGEDKANLAQNIVISSLRLEYSTWLEPDIYGTPSDVQANEFQCSLEDKDKGASYFYRPAGLVEIKAAKNITLRRCVIRNAGGDGISVSGEGDNINITGNIIENTAASGIFAGNFNYNLNIGTINITNNYIKDIAGDYGGGCGILIPFVKRATVEHNEVCYAPYTGISLGWGWSAGRTIMNDTMVRYNNVHHVMQLLNDGAAIYTLGNQQRSEIAYNYIHDIVWSPYAPLHEVREPKGALGFVFAVYLDAKTCGYTVHENFVENIEHKHNILWNKNPQGRSNPNGNKGDNITAVTQDIKVRQNAGVTAEYGDMRPFR